MTSSVFPSCSSLARTNNTTYPLVRLSLAQYNVHHGSSPKQQAMTSSSNLPPYSPPRTQMVDNKINKFRHVILEILHRLPNNEVLKPYVQELLLLVMKVVDTDNEDNAIQGLRVVFDLQKNYRPQLESEVPRFLQVWGGEGGGHAIRPAQQKITGV